MKKYISVIFIAILCLFTLVGCDKDEGKDLDTNAELRHLSSKKVAFVIGQKRFIVDLYENPTANDLYAKLPLTLTANDYAGYDEKVVRLQSPLSMQNAPEGDNPKIPEVGYYQPGNWIALYYGFIGYWKGKVPLGQIHANVDELKAIPNNSSVTIEVED